MLSPFDVTLVLVAVCMITSARQESAILIRLKNDSPYAMAKVEILSPASGLIHFGEIKAKQESSYKPVLDAYVTTAVYAEIEGKQIVFLPDDYLGEQHLSAGKYTFSLTVTEVNSERYLRVKLIVDQAKKK